MESDVGAGVSIISQDTYNRHSKETPLQPSNTCLQTYTRHCVKIFGQFLVQFKYQNHNVTVPLLVVKACDHPFLEEIGSRVSNWIGSQYAVSVFQEQASHMM